VAVFDFTNIWTKTGGGESKRAKLLPHPGSSQIALIIFPENREKYREF
jgi:hypothetical protein